MRESRGQSIEFAGLAALRKVIRIVNSPKQSWERWRASDFPLTDF
jgi:hypothetical protein